MQNVGVAWFKVLFRYLPRRVKRNYEDRIATSSAEIRTTYLNRSETPYGTVMLLGPHNTY